MHSKVPESVYSLSDTREAAPRDSVEINCTDPKQQFYALCLGVKAGLSAGSAGQTVSITTLFEAAVEQQLTPDQWLAFIEKSIREARVPHQKISKKPRARMQIFDTLVSCK